MKEILSRIIEKIKSLFITDLKLADEHTPESIIELAKIDLKNCINDGDTYRKDMKYLLKSTCMISKSFMNYKLNEEELKKIVTIGRISLKKVYTLSEKLKCDTENFKLKNPELYEYINGREVDLNLVSDDLSYVLNIVNSKYLKEYEIELFLYNNNVIIKYSNKSEKLISEANISV